MKKYAAVFFMILALFVCAACSGPYIGEVEIFGHTVREDTAEITFSGDEIPGIPELSANLKLLEKLEKVDLGSFHMFEAEMRSLSDEFPGVTFEYIPYVSVAGSTIPNDVEALDLEGSADYDRALLKQELSAFKNLKRVSFGNDLIPADALAQLETAFPQVEFSAIVTYNVAGRDYREDITGLDLSGSPVTEDLLDALKHFPQLEEVDLHGTGMPREQLLALKTAYPDIMLKAEVELAGEILSTEAEELDFNNKLISDYDQFYETLALFDHLSRVEMCDCGLSNELLGALRDAYPNTKFVWRIYLGRKSLRTDAVAFSTLVGISDYLTSEDIEVLKYCTDLQSLDLGHQALTDLSVIGEYLTELRILIVADNRITDLSPLAKLPHLHYLEFFVNQVTDLTPLAQCRELVDLNISCNPVSDITPILDLPLLERLWMVAVRVSGEDVALLRETYPEATVSIWGNGSTDQGWRTHDRYFAMMDMYYKGDYMSEEFSKYDGLVGNAE